MAVHVTVILVWEVPLAVTLDGAAMLPSPAPPPAEGHETNANTMIPARTTIDTLLLIPFILFSYFFRNKPIS
jgi:hypothetical protein